MDEALVARWQGFQDEVVDWSRRNFGEQSTFAPLVGMIEEIGEFYDAVRQGKAGEMEDALHDATVYMMDFTGRRGIPMRDVLLEFKSDCMGFVLYDDFASPLHRVHGQICHATLKLEQKIRVNEDHRQRLVKALASWLQMLICMSGQPVEVFVEDVLAITWAKVKRRDWKANPTSGVESQAQERSSGCPGKI